ncbi:MAG: hypothetical protein J6W96_02335 [Alphaproteobacteria bacterium]|nr:hypothetical protein [Alphaproteobacteria bacterium]
MSKGNKILVVLVLACLVASGYSAWTCYSLQKEVKALQQERLAMTTQNNDIFSEALKIISGNNPQPAKKKGLMDKAKSAAQAKALDVMANKVKRSVQEKAETNGTDATVALKGIDMIFKAMQKAIDAEEGNATEADVAREFITGLKRTAETAVQEDIQEEIEE